MFSNLLFKKRFGMNLISFLILFFISVSVYADSDDSNVLKVNEIFKKFTQKDQPGLSLAIIKEGKIVYKKGFGMAKIKENIPNNFQTVFDIGSITKSFTAACVGILIQEGKVLLNDLILKYFPELPKDVYGKVKLEHLIYNSSGIRNWLDFANMAGLYDEESDEPNELIKMLCRQKALNFKPGEKYLYSNSNYFILAQLIERISGKSISEFARGKIFHPLKMLSTQFQKDQNRVVKNKANGYIHSNNGFKISNSTTGILGDGGVISNVDDMVIWAKIFLNGNFNRNLVEMMIKPSFFNNGKLNNYVFGLNVLKRNGLKLIEHGGAWGGFRSIIRLYPKKKFGLILLANVNSIFLPDYAKKIEDIYLFNDLKSRGKKISKRNNKKIIKLPVKILNKYIGDYFEKNWCVIWRLNVENNELIFGSQNRVFSPVNEVEFISFKPKSSGRSLKFYEDKNNNYSLVYSTGTSNFTFKKLKLLKPDNSILLNYCGKYYSEELDVVYKFSIENKTLKLHSVKNFEGLLLESSFKDKFYNSSWRVSFEFQRDQSGNISGFILNTLRSKGFIFRKTDK